MNSSPNLQTTKSTLISLKGGKVQIDGALLIDNVNFSLSPARVTGVIGQNGSGKSTLVRVLARQQFLTAGTILLDGDPYALFSPRAFSRRVAYLPQYTPPTPGLTVDELVSLGRFPWHGALGRFSEQDKIAICRALAATDTQQFANRSVDLLSGGERQRCWIAMLLAQESDVLLLDEPISALDARFQTDIMALIRMIAETRNISVLVVLHDVNLAHRYCHSIVAMKSGRLIWNGPADQLMDAAILENIYDIPMRILREADTGEAFAFARQRQSSASTRY